MARYTGQVAPQFSRLHLDRDLLWIVPFRVRYILGVSGLRFAGKSAAFSHLIERRGFKLYSLATTLRGLAREQGVSIYDRTALQDFGDWLRLEAEDPGYLARRTLRQIRREHLSHYNTGAANRIVVAGFKRPEEVDVFASIRQFELIAIEAPSDKERYERAIDSGVAYRELGLAADDKTCRRRLRKRLEEEVDARDRFGKGDEDYGQAVEEVIEKVPPANVIENNGRLDELRTAVDGLVSDLDQRYRRPRG